MFGVGARARDYELIDELGHGYFGFVYRIRDKEGKELALKKIFDKKSKFTEKYKETETDVIKKNLYHENIVVLHESFIEGKNICIIMEFCEGGDLNDYFVENKTTIEQRYSLMVDISRGLNYLHSNKIIHRDLKPENILLSNKSGKQVAKISDFGISGIKDTHFDVCQTQIGCMAYLSPEIEANLQYSYPADIFAQGLLFFSIFRHNVITNFNGERSLIPAELNDKGSIVYLNVTLRQNKPSREQFLASYFDKDPDIGSLIFSMLDQKPERRPSAEHVLIGIIQEQLKFKSKLTLKEEPKPKVQSTAVSAAQEIIPSENAVVKHSDTWLSIHKQDEKGPQKALLTGEMWREHQQQLHPNNINKIYMKLVYFTDSQELFNFIAFCTETRILALYNLEDSKSDPCMIEGLSQALPNLTKLQKFDFRDTPLGDGGSSIFNSINSPDLRVLSLYKSKLTGCGQALSSCLTRLPKLGYLDVGDCALHKDEIGVVLHVLPRSCPQLSALLLNRHNLQQASLEKVISRLQKLKLLSCERCVLNAQQLNSILNKLSANIEIVSIDLNEIKVDLLVSTLQGLVRNHEKIKYLRISNDQLSAEDQKNIERELVQNGGQLMVGTDEDRWRDYIGHFERIRDQCLAE